MRTPAPDGRRTPCPGSRPLRRGRPAGRRGLSDGDVIECCGRRGRPESATFKAMLMLAAGGPGPSSKATTVRPVRRWRARVLRPAGPARPPSPGPCACCGPRDRLGIIACCGPRDRLHGRTGTCPRAAAGGPGSAGGRTRSSNRPVRVLRPAAPARGSIRRRRNLICRARRWSPRSEPGVARLADGLALTRFLASSDRLRGHRHRRHGRRGHRHRHRHRDPAPR